VRVELKTEFVSKPLQGIPEETHAVALVRPERENHARAFARRRGRRETSRQAAQHVDGRVSDAH
jgi:hypothetical protein